MFNSGLIATPHEVLKKYWGFDSFRPLQEDIIGSVLDGKDTLALLPTGGGKSVCFQVPALCKEGICLVITPLIALMTDQVESLKRKGIGAVAMHSGMHPKEVEMAFEKCADGRAKLLYISPERLETRKFRFMLSELQISLIAVDEAHCISQWGYDFRPPYLRIGEAREIFPHVPILALTATAVPRVVEDIQSKLEFDKKNVFSMSFVRKNLVYTAFEVEDKYKKLLRICNGVNGCGIVYVRSRRLCKELAEFLTRSDVTAGFYHAGLEPAARLLAQHDWMANRTRVIVATNAFGMGIDKADVRFVVHYDIPETLEAYYQEAGRAGRDGKKSYAVMLFNEHDIFSSRRRLELSWPDPDAVRQVYQALGNYLQLPVGAGKDVSFDFDFDALCNTYKQSPAITFSALKILERDGYISLNEQWDNPSRILITCSKDDLYRYQVEKSGADQVLRVILRKYNGVFVDFTKINENEIAQRTGIDSPKVRDLLIGMQRNGILEYIQQHKLPQIVFSIERLDIKDISLSKTYYFERKKEAFEKLESVFKYAYNRESCRSKMLVEYFGEKRNKRCGNCDNCLDQYGKEPDKPELELIEKEINNILQAGPSTIEGIVAQIPHFKEAHILTVVRWLAEDEIIKQKDGQVFLAKTEK